MIAEIFSETADEIKWFIDTPSLLAISLMCLCIELGSLKLKALILFPPITSSTFGVIDCHLAGPSLIALVVNSMPQHVLFAYIRLFAFSPFVADRSTLAS